MRKKKFEGKIEEFVEKCDATITERNEYITIVTFNNKMALVAIGCNNDRIATVNCNKIKYYPNNNEISMHQNDVYIGFSPVASIKEIYI